MVLVCKRNFVLRKGFFSLRFKKGEKFTVHYEDKIESFLGRDYIVKAGFKIYINHMAKDFDEKFEEEGIDYETLRDYFREL